ncbi:hypothetical protein AVEN_244446-1 [Araneus ventricosus]|uniref:Tc3 transposase DNA binding domain-containing protein n=1 Tax=Araneus ventricosus TaxID=182803 RepID=A0A4Y2HYL7_ARAVE|nr:hypothetical protein AVEN_244446-1 [Araneus ventricosus]
MDKTSDLDAFYRGQIVGARRLGHSIYEIVRELGYSRSTVSRVYREYTDGGKKTSDQANCKGQLALKKRCVRRNVLNLCLDVWQPLSRPEEAQIVINLLSLIQWHFSV